MRKELEKCRQLIEARNSKIEEINEVRKDGSRICYTVIDGKREGDFFIWYKNGRKSTQATYKDDVSIVSTSYYDIEGSPKKHAMYRGPNRKEKEYGWDEKGNLIYQAYVSEEGPDDCKNNWKKSWYADGVIRSEIKYNRVTNFIDQVEWYSNGNEKLFLSKGFDNKKVPVEIHKSWYPNGQQKREETIRSHAPDGRVYEWDENGNLITNEFWVNGYLDREKSDPKMVRNHYRIRQ